MHSQLWYGFLNSRTQSIGGRRQFNIGADIIRPAIKPAGCCPARCLGDQIGACIPCSAGVQLNRRNSALVHWTGNGGKGMFERLVRLSRVAVVGLAAMQLMTSAAMAQYYGGDDDYRPPRWQRDQGRDWDRPPPRGWDRDRGGCDRGELMRAARAEGFRRIDSVQSDGRRIVVRGWNDGGPDRMVFANRRGCPSLR